jgi:hypothetical protein
VQTGLRGTLVTIRNGSVCSRSCPSLAPMLYYCCASFLGELTSFAGYFPDPSAPEEWRFINIPFLVEPERSAEDVQITLGGYSTGVRMCLALASIANRPRSREQSRRWVKRYCVPRCPFGDRTRRSSYAIRWGIIKDDLTLMFLDQLVRNLACLRQSSRQTYSRQ